MTVDSVARQYLSDLRQSVINAGGGGTGSLELATRPVVHRFLETVVQLLRPGTVVHHESQVDPLNRPDWRFEDPATFGVYAYADHKSLSLRGPLQLTNREQEQIQRYLDFGRPVFVFDGVEFLFHTDDSSSPERVSLVPKPLDLDADWSQLPLDPAVQVKLQSLLAAPGFRRWTETELIEQLALRARLLSRSIALLLEAPRGSGANAAEEELLGALHGLWALARTNHDPGLASSHACADFVAQVLVFGLFYAHVGAPRFGKTPVERRKHIEEFWTSAAFEDRAAQLRPFHTIVSLLGGALAAQNALSVWYQEAAGVLAHAEYMGTEIGPVDFHALFERFFVAFDRETRFDRGVFYTPSAVTSWMAEATEELLNEHLRGGIATKVDKLIDPCAGTGGFLEAVIERVGDVPEGPHFVGLEVLPAPYALTHYRLSRVTEGWNNPPNVSIALTDTLSDRLVNPPPSGRDGFSDELAEAATLARPPVRVVIGNPPSSIHVASGAPRTRIDGLLDDYRPPVIQRRGRQNIQQALNNEAFRFLRWSAEQVLDSGTGVVAVVLPGAFAYAVSFSYARKWLLDHFDAIYVLMLDRDIRTGQSVGQSMFQVLQGRLILFAVRSTDQRTPSETTHAARTYVHDIAEGTREEKEEYLSRESAKITDFRSVEVRGPAWRFQSATASVNRLWSFCWPLRSADGQQGIFLSKCSAVKLAPTALLFHTEEAILRRRSAALAARSGASWARSTEELRRDWWQGQRKPPHQRKLTDGVRAAAAQAARDGRAISRYTFRPFLDGYVLEDDDLFVELRRAGGDGTRARPEIRAAFSQGSLGIAVAPAPVDLGTSLTRFVSFCWHLPDNDISARGNAMIFCDRFPEERRGRSWDPSVRDNIDAHFAELFPDPADALFYVYAIMSCGSYLDTFSNELYQPANPEHPPRVPLVADPDMRSDIASLGRRVAECEKPDFEAPPLPLRTVWPNGLAEFRLERADIDPAEGEVQLVGSNGETVSLSGVPSAVLSLRISGHSVIDKWIREKTSSYLRRTFRPEDLSALESLITRVAHQQILLEEVSVLLDGALASEDVLPPPRLSAAV